MAFVVKPVNVALLCKVIRSVQVEFPVGLLHCYSERGSERSVRLCFVLLFDILFFRSSVGSGDAASTCFHEKDLTEKSSESETLTLK